MTENIEKNFSNYEIKDKDIIKKEYNQILYSMKEVKETFKKLIKEDNNLANNFKNKNVDFTNINIAGVLLAGIDMRNMSAKNENELEKYPYNDKQIKLVDRYNRLQRKLEELEQYAKTNIELEDEEEMEE